MLILYKIICINWLGYHNEKSFREKIFLIKLIKSTPDHTR